MVGPAYAFSTQPCFFIKFLLYRYALPISRFLPSPLERVEFQVESQLFFKTRNLEIRVRVQAARRYKFYNMFALVL